MFIPVYLGVSAGTTTAANSDKIRLDIRKRVGARLCPHGLCPETFGKKDDGWTNEFSSGAQFYTIEASTTGRSAADRLVSLQVVYRKVLADALSLGRQSMLTDS